MKILHIHDKDQELVLKGTEGDVQGLCIARGGGLTVYLSQLIAGQRAQGCDIAVVGLTRGSTEETTGHDGSYLLKSFRYRYRPEVAAELLRIVDQEKPDIIHLHSMPTLHPIVVRRLRAARPVVWMFHDVTPVCFRRTKLLPDGRQCTHRLGFGCVLRGCHRPGDMEGLRDDVLRVLSHPLYLRLYRTMPALMVPSSYLKGVLVANGIAADRISVVPLFSRFEATGTPASNGNEPPGILFVGRLNAEKGILSLVEMLARLSGERWQATIVGDGPLRDRTRELADRRGLGGRLEFVGEAAADDLASHYRACDIVVLPSLAPESFGMVGVEAMSFGRPIVAFDSGGVAEWLRDGVNGYAVPPGDTDALAAAVRRLLRDAVLRADLGQAGLRLQRERFTQTCHLDSIFNLYRRVIAAHDDARTHRGPSPSRS
jgi:glycosyltransferase involved in cell wall biosynthesis